MRHGRGADLARLGLLPEITQRYVAPQIAVEIEEHGVGARERVELLGEAVVRLDLGGVRSELEAERLDESPGEALPIEVRVRGDVSVVVAHRAVHLPGEGHRGDRAARAPQPVHHVRKLLAERRRRGWLAVGAREHRRIGEPHGERGERLDHAIERGQQHPVAPFLQHQSIGEIVDILRSAGEMHELGDARAFRIASQPLFHPVLDRLHVVVGLGLDGLYLCGVLLGEVLDDPFELGVGRFREGLDLGDRWLGGEREEPADLDCDAVAEQRGFAEAGAQRLELLVIASVQRG